MLVLFWQSNSDKNVNLIFGKTKPHKNVFWQKLFGRNVCFILANNSDKNVNLIFGKTKPHKNIFWHKLFGRNVGFILVK